MTDEQIIKALECCNTDVRENTCPKCAFYKKHRCSTLMQNAVIDLINRQKAENERLEKELMKCKIEKEMLYNVGVEIQTIAIKEFAERLKQKLQWDVEFDNKIVFESDIDNLVKEMTEE